MWPANVMFAIAYGTAGIILLCLVILYAEVGKLKEQVKALGEHNPRGPRPQPHTPVIPRQYRRHEGDA